MTQLTLLDDLPAEAPPEALQLPGVASRVYGEHNRRQGHLRIDSGNLCWVFLNLGGDVIRFGEMAGPICELTPEQLRVVADYCARMAAWIEER